MNLLILGSGPDVLAAREWPRAPFDRILAINNAHAVRADWDFHIFPWDFPAETAPLPGPGQRRVLQEDFVPTQNAHGGFVYGGGTMAFTAAYWALEALRPKVMAFLGCDMVYAPKGATHFYGTGSPDPLREDISLRSLEAKAARFQILAARAGCAAVNLSGGPSRLTFPRALPATLPGAPAPYDPAQAEAALQREAALAYFTPTGRYWDEASRFDPREIDRIDSLWRAAIGLG